MTQYNHLLPDSPAHFINGKWVKSSQHDDVLNPATGKVICQVAKGDKDMVDKAVQAAVKAQKAWASKPQPERATFLEAWIEQIKQNHEALATLLTTEQGKPLSESRGEVDMAITMLRYAANFAWKRQGDVLAPSAPQQHSVTREVPLGVIGAIIPWNFPLALFLRKAAPALIAGNSIVIKPSEVTPLSSLALATLSQKAGIPEGIVNVVCGEGRVVGDAIVKHPGTALITMTGSTRAGKEIMKNAAEKVIPVSLELGGKAPFIVMADADIDKAARDAVNSRMANCGQVCICNERTYVQRAVYDKFIRALEKAAQEVVVGDPLQEGTIVGPKVSPAEKKHVDELLETTLKEGGKILWQAKLPQDPELSKGNWVAPVIVTDLPEDATILSEEVFGPVLPVVVFDTQEEVIEKANAAEYGLSSYLYTSSLSTAFQISDQLEYGEVYINRFGPEEINGFHAGWKLSGLGGDDGEYGYQLYIKRKTVYIDYQ
ncbi:aldehyde dehydrogenase family protein [Tatumella sp. UBA2305]|uniref:aldehyde dehydrogenase family protein n=1 Tax=Tatumella sp. UBA2305 TaxID=1947647 RepID=UPI0025D6745A|nr:aldehyde dehydrogenase family protein [Tatumella sp. UBA2305]